MIMLNNGGQRAVCRLAGTLQTPGRHMEDAQNRKTTCLPACMRCNVVKTRVNLTHDGA